MSLKLVEENPWYKDGLRFNCTGCGQCCTGSPGYIWVTQKEIHTIMEFLKISYSEFEKKYLRRIKNRFSLIEKPINYDCIFLENNKCSIYSVRPKQCRTYPWWKQNLKTREDWEAAAKMCEGINNEAPVVPYSEITKQLNIQNTES